MPQAPSGVGAWGGGLLCPTREGSGRGHREGGTAPSPENISYFLLKLPYLIDAF